MSNSRRCARRLIRWYPRAWRQNHEEEFLALLEDSMSERRLGLRRSLDVALHGVRLRSKELRTSPRRRLYSVGGSIVLTVLAFGLITNSLGLFTSTGPTKGSMPYDFPSGPSYSEIPDFVSVFVNSHTTGYTPKAYIAAPGGPRQNSLLGQVAPVYASNLTTLLGHEYPGIGFVAIGTSPWTQPCHLSFTISVSSSGVDTKSLLPCPSAKIVLPNVSGVVTPTGVAELSRLGIGVDVVDVSGVELINPQTGKVLPGHIVRTSPRGGSTVHGRQVVTVYNAIR